MKGEINGLIDGWRKSKSESHKTRARLFDRRVADALVVALQGDGAHAVELLTDTKRDIVAERTSIARTSYLFTSFATTALLVLIFGAFYLPQAATRAGDGFFDSMCLSAAVGALGAFFSIALAIRGRQIGTDLQWRDNHADAVLRVVIGSISGVVLYWLLHAKIVTFGFGNVSFGEGDAATSLDVKRCFVLVTAFAAGTPMPLEGTLGRLDGHHIGAEIAEDLDAHRSQQEVVEADDARAFEQIEHVFFLKRRSTSRLAA